MGDYGHSQSHSQSQKVNFPSSGDCLLKLEQLESETISEKETGEFRHQVPPNSHNLLRGGRAPYTNSLSPREMESLTAICNTFLPSIQISPTANDSLGSFYKTSASMAQTPDHVGGFLSERLRHPSLILLRLALWALSTWYGTFLVCGRLSFSTHFPYFQSFSQVSQQRREEILLSWSMSSFFLYGMLFKALKFLIFLVFFTKVDEKNENPSWKAIGYCGPDPDFINQRIHSKQAEDNFGPLYKSIINMETTPIELVSQTLLKAGFSASVPLRRRPHHKSSDIKEESSLPCMTIRCDAVVIGSGSGGGVVAGVLAKSGYKVLVLEKGNYYARRNLSLLEGPSMDQMYEGGGLLATNDVGVVVLAGSTVGGGSAINWSASIRPPAHVMDEWCDEFQLGLFNSKAYKEALDVVCERMGVQSGISEEGFNNAALRRGCLEMGYPMNDIPRNSPASHYCGWCCFGCKDGRKKGTQETWLLDMADSGNGLVLSGCKALKVLHWKEKKKKSSKGRNKATGVVFEFEGEGEEVGKRLCVVESKVTVVACGALGTPGLLKRSGLRNANIGKHLHLHPTVMAWGYFPHQGWPEEEKRSYEGGIMTAMCTAVANFNTTGYGAVIQTPALHPGMFSVLMPWISSFDMKERMSRFSQTAHIFALARDKGSGRVSHPSNFLSYDLDVTDEENLQRGVEKMLRILVAAGAEEIGTHHRKGERLNVKQASSHEFERFVKRASGRRLRDWSTPICSAHQMGSCRMGVDPQTSVVNQRAETWEVEDLFVADSSVFPTALGVNPMVTVQAIAYCTAHTLVEVLRRKKDN